MDVLLMLVPLVLGGVGAESWPEVEVELGQDVTLTCSVRQPNIHWYMEIHSRFRGCIARTFTRSSAGTQYYVSTVQPKYAAVQGNRLLITNVTAEDCRLYFCAIRQNDSLHFQDTFSIVSRVPSSGGSEAERPVSEVWGTEPVLYGSLALNVLFLFVGTGLGLTRLCWRRKSCDDQVNSPPFTCETPQMLEPVAYEEIQPPAHRAPPPAAPAPHCIYYKAQLPRSSPPGHPGHPGHLDGR